MPKKIFHITVFCVFLGATCPAYGLDLEYKDYEVQRGDTLWDISSRELKDPFLWPNIWKENTKLKNPDNIYPSQHIRIPFYLLQKQFRLAPPADLEEERELDLPKTRETPAAREIPETPAPGRETAVPSAKPPTKKYLVDKKFILASGYISPDIPSVGSISETPDGREMVAKNDHVYIKIKGDESVGRKFYSFRVFDKVKHPKGGMLGHLIEITGVAEIVGQESGNVKAVITDSFQEVNVGDYLQDYFEIEPPVKTKTPRTPDIKGMVVTTKQLRTLSGMGDIVYIDRGSDAGVATGDVFNVISGEYPNIQVGKIMVILTKNETATAFVTKSRDVIEKGDNF